MKQGLRAPLVCFALAMLVTEARLDIAGAAEPNASADEVHRASKPFAGDETVTREALVRTALARNPSIAAARAAWRAATAVPPQARAFGDPRLQYSFGPDSIGDNDVRFAQVFELSQPLPFPGKRALREAVAVAEARAEAGELDDVQREVAAMASVLYDDYWAVERALEINAIHQALLRELLRAATAAYTTGRIAQFELIRAEVELAHIDHARVVLRAERESTLARLRALLHIAAQAALPPTTPDLRDPPLPTLALDELVSAALAAHPQVKAARARLAAAEQALRLAKREYFPDFSVGATYNNMWNAPEHRTMIGFGIEIPLQLGRRRAAVAEADARVASRRSELAALEDQLRGEVASAYAQLTEAHHVVQLYRDRILPASRDRLQSARVGFEAGRVAFESVVEAERALRDAEVDYFLARATLGRRRAELDRALGRFPFGIEAGAAGQGELR